MNSSFSINSIKPRFSFRLRRPTRRQLSTKRQLPIRRQQGAVTLLLTSLLLVVILLLTLGSYRITFHQIKIGQNELTARRLHWMAEGAIECLFTYLRVSNVNPAELTEGNSSTALSEMQSLCLNDLTHQALFTELDATHHYRLVFAWQHQRLVSKSVVAKLHDGQMVYFWLQGSWRDW